MRMIKIYLKKVNNSRAKEKIDSKSKINYSNIIMEYQKNNEFIRQYTKSTNQICDKKLGWNKWWKNINSPINSMLRAILCDYNDAYTLSQETMIVAITGTAGGDKSSNI